MMLVAERHHLPARNMRVSGVRGPIDRIDDAPERKKGHNPADQNGSRQSITAAPEDLRHRNSPLSPENYPLLKPQRRRREHGAYSPSASETPLIPGKRHPGLGPFWQCL